MLRYVIFLLTVSPLFCFSQVQNTSLAVKDTPGTKRTKIRLNCSFQTDSLKPKPLFVVNGFIVAASIFAEINPAFITSINVLIDANALKAYGDEAKNGVIEVFLHDKEFTRLKINAVFKPIL